MARYVRFARIASLNARLLLYPTTYFVVIVANQSGFVLRLALLGSCDTGSVSKSSAPFGLDLLTLAAAPWGPRLRLVRSVSDASVTSGVLAGRSLPLRR